METHNRENNLKFNCWTCGASYARAFALKDHIREHHGEEAMGMEEATNSVADEEEAEAQTVLVTLEETSAGGDEEMQIVAVAAE